MKRLSFLRKLPLIWIGMVLALPASAQYSRIDNATEAQIDTWFANDIAADKTVGAAIGIVKNGEIVFLKGYGKADRGNDIDADECTLFRMGSVSKIFTATVAMQLWEEGKLDFNTVATDIVPEYPPRQEGDFTVGHLLSHRSGMDGAGIRTSTYADENPSYNAIEAIEIFKNRPLDTNTVTIPLAPANGVYSNWGFNFLGAVIQRRGKAPYEQQVMDRIARPLKMPRFQAEYIWKDYLNRSRLYAWDTGLKQMVQLNESQGKFVGNLPSGGHVSSIVDLALFAKAFGDGTLLSQQARDSMTTYHSTIDGKGTDYGYGMQLETYNGIEYPFHGGGIPGGAGIIYFSPDLQNAVVVLANAVDSYNDIRAIARTTTEFIGNISVNNNLPAYNPNNLAVTGENVSQNQNGNEVFQATHITASAVMGNGSEIRMEAEAIVLLPGFTAAAGSDFLAHLGTPNEDCALQQGGGNKTQPDLPASLEAATLELFPNPSHGRTTIRSDQEIQSVEVFDLYGKTVLTTGPRNTSEIQLNLSDLPAGTYIARVFQADGEPQLRKFILTH